MMEFNGLKVPKAAVLLFWAALWEIVGQFKVVPLFPPLSEVLMALPDVLTTASFAGAAPLTVTTYLAGLALAVVVAVGLGMLMGLVKIADNILNIWMNIFLPTLVPVVLILFGMGLPALIATVSMLAVWIIALAIRVGVLNVSSLFLEMSTSFGASRQERCKIILPSAVPEILSGARPAVIRGVRSVAIGLLLVSIIGLGALFSLYSQNFLTAHFWAFILLLLAFALSLADLIARLEHRIECYVGERA